eukprot:3301395-Amphidinium_carterae.1
MAHPAYSTVNGFISYLSNRRPGCFWVEEVLAFQHVDKDLKRKGVAVSHLEEWSRAVTNLGYSIRVLQIDHQIWVACRRPRLLILAVSKVCGGSIAAQWMAEAVLRVVRHRQLQRPLDIFELVDLDSAEEKAVRERELEVKAKKTFCHTSQKLDTRSQLDDKVDKP